jgi:hypothetical protein
MIKYLNGRLIANQWLLNEPAHDCYGVLLRKTRNVYICEPEEIHPQLLAAVQKINVEVAFTMSTETTEVIFSLLQPHQEELILPNGSHLQVIESIAEIATSPSSIVKKFQYASLIREEQMLLVWHDELDKILSHAADLEGRLLALVWGSSSLIFPTNISGFRSLQPSVVTSPSESTHHIPIEPKAEAGETVHELPAGTDEESGKSGDSLDRPIALISAVFIGMGVFLIITLLVGFNTSNLIFESMVDGNWLRLALAATLPLFILFSSFFFFVIFGDFFQAVGPIKLLRTNSRFYSPLRPGLSEAYAQGFTPPRVTIQMPVYTESLDGVIIPTITSLKAAISHYESHGGQSFPRSDI